MENEKCILKEEKGVSKSEKAVFLTKFKYYKTIYFGTEEALS